MRLQTEYYINAFYLKPTKNKKIFISCAQNDIVLANNLATDLKMEGFEVFLFTISLKLGQNIMESISDNIRDADYLIPLISKDYVLSQFCKDELNSYYMLHIKEKPNTILPIKIDEVTIPSIFASYKYFDYMKENYHLCISEIKRSIK